MTDEFRFFKVEDVRDDGIALNDLTLVVDGYNRLARGLDQLFIEHGDPGSNVIGLSAAESMPLCS